jgi:autotransporter-associated beta strand protein
VERARRKSILCNHPPNPLKTTTNHKMFLSWISSSLSRCLRSIWLLGILFVTAAGHGQSLQWNPAQNSSGPSDGSGSWLASGVWWNGTANINGTWAGTTPSGAVFGAGTPGNYTVTLSSPVEATNVTFNTSGYTLSGSPLAIIAANSTPGITIAAGVTSQIAVVMTNSPGWEFLLGANSQLTLSGGVAVSGGNNPRFLGSSLTTCTVNITNGTYNESGTFDFNGVTANIFGGSTVVNGPSRLDIGSAAAATVNVSGYGQLNANTGYDDDTNSNFQISRGQIAILNVLTNGVVSTFNNGVYPGGNLVVLPDSSSQGTLNVLRGGIVNIGTGPDGTPGVNSTDLCSLILLGGNKSTLGTTFSAGASGIVNVSGGIVTALGIQFGSQGGIYTANPTVQFNLTNGTVYLGSGGIGLGTGVTGLTSPTIMLAGGTLGALANWSSTMPMSLVNSGTVTLQTADANGNAANVTLSGVLSGNGSLNKTGSGILTLAATSTYSGATTVNAGSLVLTTASTGAGAYVVGSNAVLNLEAASLGSSLNMSSLTLSNGAILTLSPNTFGNLTAPLINVTGALNPASTVTINFNASDLPDGQYPLIKYGSLAGAGFSAFVLGSVTLPAGTAATVALVNDTANQSVDLSLTADATPALKWDGTVNGNWDIGVTANWQTNAYYTQSNGVGPEVVFDDTAQGPNTAIVLNTTVSPAAIVASNSVLSYSINGTGGIAGNGSLLKNGTGTLVLGGNNSYEGGTTIDEGTLTLGPTNNAAMAYTVNGGVLNLILPARNTSLAMSSLTMGSSAPQLSFNLGGLANIGAPAMDVSGNLVMDGNVVVNVTNTPPTATEVLLQYSGTRSGVGSFVAGSVPAGASIVDDTASKQVQLVYQLGPRVVVPVYNTNEVVVAVTTPQEYGAVGDGITDDSAAFQRAINAVYNAGGNGGGVIYIPPGQYAFYTNITVPTGVTLHGDWTDWTKGTGGLVGTTFDVYYGAGQTNAAPFINTSISASLRDINIWYPNQNPSSITGYPYAIEAASDVVVQNVVLVNAYQGILCNGSEFILSSVIGTPLFMGVSTTGTIADISQTEDIRFSPNVWPASGLPNAPAAGGAYATWMRTYGTGMQVFRLDGLINVNTEISGYNVGLDFEINSAGQAGCAFYNGWVTNCATAMLAQEMQTAEGLEVSDFTLDGDTAISRTHATNDAAAEFDDCQIIGRNGTAVSCLGANWQSSMSFQNCTISNALSLTGPGVFNLVNCQLLGSTQCVMSATANAVAFTGCTFSPAQKIINNGSANNLLIDSRQAISNAMPVFNWTNVMANFASRQPAKTNLFIATNYGATGNGVTDDTLAIQAALAAAGTNGGGIVYLPPGQYHVTNTLDVPSGTELRGSYELRHSTWPGADGIFKGAILQPYGGQGTTNGPPAIALEANSGLVGLTISYESQWTNCFPFPPAIQGRGPNVYMIGIQCPQPYYYVDLDTYTCTNHFIDMLDGWALNTGVKIGNGSSGTIADCHANWTFWIDNFASPHALQSAAQPPVNGFVMSNLQYYVVGNCSELFVKDFSIIENMYMHCSSENGIGPTVTGISAMCDATYQCFVFDSSAPCIFNDVNPEWLVSLNGGYSGLTNQAIILTTTNFQGTVRFFNSPVWGSHNSDYIINGGDVGLELAHLWQYAYDGTKVNGGAFHLINCGAFNVVDGGSGSPVYNLTFGPDAGIDGITNEVIGCFSYSGWNVAEDDITSPANVWMDYAISNDSVLDFGPVVIGDVYPDGIYQFEPSSVLSFLTYSPYGINPSGISVALTQTNLLGQGRSTTYTTANGLVVSGTNALSVTAPLVTNMLYNAVIKVTDADGNTASNVLSFSTVSPAMTFEAEDFDYNGGDYIANPVPDAYANLSGDAGIDYSNGISGQGSDSYRPQGLETEADGDQLRASYGGLPDYDVGFANTGNWGNYTRPFPAGSYNIYIRIASPNGAQSQVIGLSEVTSGWGTSSQTTTSLGTFSYQDTGSWQTYAWMPLLGSNGQPFVFQGGSTETLRATELKTGYNINYYMLVATNAQLIPPQGQVMLQVSGRPASNVLPLVFAWPGSISDTVTNLYWTPSLTPPITWTRMTNAPVFTNGQWTVTLPMGTNNAGFYRLQ